MRPNVTAWHPGLHTLLTRMAVGGLLVLSGATAAYAGPENGPTLSVIGGTGIPGGTVNVKFALSNDPNNLACAAGITVTFDPDILVFTGGARPPRCTVDPRLSSSHVIQGPGESESGVFDADVF